MDPKSIKDEAREHAASVIRHNGKIYRDEDEALDDYRELRDDYYWSAMDRYEHDG